MRKGCDRTREIAILPQFLAIEPHFVQKVARDAFKIIILRQFFGDRTSFRAKKLRSDKRKSKSHFYLSFWRSNLISCERVAIGQVQIAILPQFLTIEPHFVRKGCAGRFQNHNFTAVFGDRTSFRAKGMRGTSANRNFTRVFGDRTSFRATELRFVPSRWHCPAP